MNLVKQYKKKKLRIAEYEERSDLRLGHIHQILGSMLNDGGEDTNRIINFISYHRYPAKFRESFQFNQDYLTYMAMEPKTLQQEKVKSFEELLIADWLTLHGIKYEYEKPYHAVNTGSLLRRQYRPDFYLTDYDIYLEHFWNKKKNGDTAQELIKKGIMMTYKMEKKFT